MVCLANKYGRPTCSLSMLCTLVQLKPDVINSDRIVLSLHDSDCSGFFNGGLLKYFKQLIPYLQHLIILCALILYRSKLLDLKSEGKGLVQE